LEDRILENLSESIVDSLIDGINNNGTASIVVCGGSSPLPLYDCLSRKDLDWSKVSVFLGDDRMVSANHVDSNEYLIKQNLLINKACSASFYQLNKNNILKKLNIPFDIVLIGLGNDGHFASLFPAQLSHDDAFDYKALPDLVISDEPLGKPPHKRISMNLSLLLNTKRCILLVTNISKREIVNKALTNKQLPLHFLLTQNKTKIEFSDTDF